MRLTEKFPNLTNVRDRNGRTPLHFAVMRANPYFFDLFQITAGVTDANLPNNDGRTPLHIACFFGTKDTVKLLMERAKADPKVRTSDGQTTLHLAVKAFANPIAGNLPPSTPTSELVFGLGAGMRQALLQQSLEITSKYYDPMGTVKLLLASGVDDAVEDVQGNTAADLAQRLENRELVGLFIAHGREGRQIDESTHSPLTEDLGQPSAELGLDDLDETRGVVGQKVRGRVEESSPEQSPSIHSSAVRRRTTRNPFKAGCCVSLGIALLCTVSLLILSL